MLIQLWLPFSLGAAHGAVDAAGLVGAVLACTSAATMLLAPVWGSLADRRPRGQVLALTILLPVPLLAGLGLVASPWAVAILFLGASALGSEAVAILGGEVSRRVPAQQLGAYFGWSNTVTQLGSAAAAAVLPMIVVRSSDLAVWLCIVLYVACAAIVLPLTRAVRVPTAPSGVS
jgi:MFS family permease